MDKRMDRRTDRRLDRLPAGQMDVENFSPFYRTSSPIGAAAMLPEGGSRPINKSRARELLTICYFLGNSLSSYSSSSSP